MRGIRNAKVWQIGMQEHGGSACMSYNMERKVVTQVGIKLVSIIVLDYNALNVNLLVMMSNY